MRNHEVTKSQLLLDEHGELREPGWSRSLVQQYRRSDIKAPKFRIKEWDYYLILHDGSADSMTLTVAAAKAAERGSVLVARELPKGRRWKKLLRFEKGAWVQ